MRTLLVFLKYPAAGQVKMRLAAAIGPKRAADLYRQWIGMVFERVQAVRGSTRVIACYDGAPCEAFAEWQAVADGWWPQPAGDLGDRLDAAFRSWQAEGDPAVAIGTDCLDLDAAHVESAFDILRKRDAVFGPAEDGGYYLVGLARYRPDFFRDIPWSTSDTLAAHQSICERKGWSVGLLPPLADIDTLDDWQQYERRQERQP
ncbi:MAG: TIGR04282 family arsenosugar biosynthesis glycosyltransferase [Pirellulales bacterium]